MSSQSFAHLDYLFAHKKVGSHITFLEIAQQDLKESDRLATTSVNTVPKNPRGFYAAHISTVEFL